MIHPNMCTMLAFITTDAVIGKDTLQKALSEDVRESCFVFHENTSLANVDYNRNTAALFFFLRIT